MGIERTGLDFIIHTRSFFLFSFWLRTIYAVNPVSTPIDFETGNPLFMIPLIEFTAVVVCALYGILRAGRKQLDFVGVAAVAFAVAFGGGTLRDLFLDRHPLFWIANAHYPVWVFFIALFGSLVPRVVARFEKYLVLPDALGLGLFSIVGTAYALESNTSWFVASLLGVITGTAGGVIADVLCNEIPSLFRVSPLYATCSFFGSWVYILSAALGLPPVLHTGAGIAATVALRLLAVRFNISLPATKP